MNEMRNRKQKKKLLKTLQILKAAETGGNWSQGREPHFSVSLLSVVWIECKQKSAPPFPRMMGLPSWLEIEGWGKGEATLWERGIFSPQSLG